LDSDDVWLPNKLEEHHEYIKNNPEINIHQTDEIWIRNNIRVNPGKKHKKKGGYIFNDSLDLCLISPSTAAVNRNIFSEYGYFEESLPACEDYDLWLRITLKENIGLIDKKLAVRYGGNEDQLSRKHWGLDRFRIYSIVKLLNNQADSMSKEQIENAKKAAINKAKILLAGAIKRNRPDYSKKIEHIINLIIDGSYNSKDYQILLEK